MLREINLRYLRAFRKLMANAIGWGGCLTLAWSANAQLESGSYLTVPDATVLESGDYVTNGSRIMPCSAILTFDLAGAQPSLTAVIYNAVLEGGTPYADFWLGGRQQPFELTVHSSSGTQLADGTYKFSGDYLQDIYPSGSQYIFEWQFSAVSGGDPVWSGHTYWAGGHLWSKRFPA